MKLLSWMLTIMPNGLNPPKEFKGDLCCLRAQELQVQDIRTNSFAFSGLSYDLKPPKVEEELWFDEEGFCGFLTIGTLGTDPETPKFSAMVAEDDVTVEKKMTKLITEKLGKFLQEHPNAKEDKESNLYHLRGYDLFRSSIELTKKSNGEVKKKKNFLTSLFKRRQTVQAESYIEKHGPRDVIKRICEKLHGASSKTRNDDDDDADDDDDDDFLNKKKDLRKSVQNFRSKVHPVLHSPARDDNEIDDRRKLDLKVPSITGVLGSSSISEANMRRENWIKTDSEYLVLEL